MKKILPIHMGGTISCVITEDGAKPRRPFSELLQLLKENASAEALSFLDGVEIASSVNPFGENGIESSLLQIPDFQRVVQTVIDNYDAYDGFIITHGTDTMAFTASFLAMGLRNINKPVVLTGAQRMVHEEGTDAFDNLRDGLRVASSEQGGVWLVFNGAVLAGSQATKVDTQSFRAFVSVHKINPLVDDFCRQEKREDRPTHFSAQFSPDVDIFYLSQTIEPTILEQYLQIRQPKGLIVLGYGMGGQRPSIWNPLGDWVAQGNTVIVKSQCLYGYTNLGRYGVGVEAKKRGLLDSADMSLEALFAKTSALIGNGMDVPTYLKLNFANEILTQ